MSGPAKNSTPAHNVDGFKIAMAMATIPLSQLPEPTGSHLSILLHYLPRGHPLSTTHTYCSTSTRPTLILPRWDPQPVGDMQTTTRGQ
jgi:hypothetical protein